MPCYNILIDEEFEKDLRFIVEEGLVPAEDLHLFKAQLEAEQKRLDADWENISRETEYPPYSTYGYRKRYFHSIPESVKAKRGWVDKKADFRIIFKVDEEMLDILYFGIGIRIKELPKNPNDIWARLSQREPPE